jgi:indolepyruvate ferredoxin oxidoreductase beta subunit
MQPEANMRPLKIAVLAMGGEGGGVLADWIVQTAERQGFHAQSTSVPGVAQRTGATIYYVEILPVVRGTAAAPIFALMPTPGDVDVVIASELMEAARAVQRGLVTPDRTLLIASSHRVYALQEKMAMGDGRVDSNAFRAQCERASRQLVLQDFAAVAEKAGSVISASLFGALAAAGLPGLPRDMCEEAIREGGVGVATSLKAFAAGFSAGSDAKPVGGEAKSLASAPADPRLEDLAQRIERDYPSSTHATLRAGIAKTSDYQAGAYAQLYLDKMDEVHRLDAARGDGSFRLTNEVARHLALWMSFEDLPRVAELKIRKSRFERVRQEIGAAPGQIVRINEYFHPRLEEIADTLPPALGRFVLRSGFVRSLLGPLTKNGRVVRSSSLVGFLALYGVSRFKSVRKYSMRYQHEMGEISGWLARIESAASQDYGLACEIAQCQRLIKGYSDTHARGKRNFKAIMSLLDQLPAADAASRVRALREAALADEGGLALEAAMRSMSPRPPSPEFDRISVRSLA